MIEERLIGLVSNAVEAAAPELGLSGDLPEIELSRPRQKEHGDFATNVALVLAPRVDRRPLHDRKGTLLDESATRG